MNNGITKRDYFASEVLKTLLLNQGAKPSMTLLHRVKYFFNIDGWHRKFNYNYSDCVKHSYIVADLMIKESEL